MECRTNKEKDFVWQKAGNMLVSSVVHTIQLNQAGLINIK